MKAVAGIVLYETPEAEVRRLKSEFLKLGVTRVLIEDNTAKAKGYAAGVNELLRRAPHDATHIIIANPDISVTTLNKDTFFDADKEFDVWGYAMNQEGVTYYGGEIDPLRMSGGLITKKPAERFNLCDFVSGSLMVIRKGILDLVGGFDESYGMYYEDVAFCFAARKAGFRVGIDAENTYEHFELSGKTPDSAEQKRRWLARSRWRFLWKNGTIRQKGYELLRLPKTLREDGKYLI